MKTLNFEIRENVLWDFETGNLEKKYEYTHDCENLAFNSTGDSILLTRSDDVSIVDRKNNDELRFFSKAPDFVTCAKFTVDGKRALSGSYYAHSIYLWDVKSGINLATSKKNDTR